MCMMGTKTTSVRGSILASAAGRLGIVGTHTAVQRRTAAGAKGQRTEFDQVDLSQ